MNYSGTYGKIRHETVSFHQNRRQEQAPFREQSLFAVQNRNDRRAGKKKKLSFLIPICNRS